MPFEFINSAENVAGQQQLWGIIISIVGILLVGFAIIKGKSVVYTLAGLALIAVGVFYLYQSRLLQQRPSQWEIRINDNGVDWRSPNETIDASFKLPLADIDFIDRSAKSNPSDPENVYHIVKKDGQAIFLNGVSGVNLEEFVRYLEHKGFQIKSTGNYFSPVELRNK